MVATYFYTYVTVQIAIVEPVLRQAVRSNLYHLGCREISFTNDLAVLRERLDSAPCDLLMLQADIGNPRTAPAMVNAIRHGELASNPFLPVVAVTHNPTAEQVKALVDAGVDDILPYPWSESYVDARLENLIHNRKPFVVTSDYIGPDRRQKTRDDANATVVKPFTVPNPLKAKALDRVSNATLEDQIRAMAQRVSTDKILRLAELCIRLAGEITALGAAGQQSSSVARNGLARLSDATRALIRRAGDSNYARACTNINTLHRTAQVMLQAIESGVEPELQLLERLALQAVHDFGVNPNLFHTPLTQDVIKKRIATAKGV